MKGTTVIPYLEYHRMSSVAGDIDPAFDALLYVCDRFELNTEQRYWLAFLYGLCYSAPTVFYVYNEFPDYENVDVGRLSRWWEANKSRCLFQTDRLRIKTQDLVIPTFLSYRGLIEGSQEETWRRAISATNRISQYEQAYRFFRNIRNFGRFTMFNYLQAVEVLTGVGIEPDRLDLDEAESCRNGLTYAIERPDLNTHEDGRRLTLEQRRFLDWNLTQVAASAIEVSQPRHRSLWSVETTLCAYKKYRRGQRYVGYYIDRMGAEIVNLQTKVPDGVCWDVLWQFRSETYAPNQLWETNSQLPPKLAR